MLVEIILKEYVPKLGDKDELVKVKRGYAMNYLIPKGLAILATAPAKKRWENEQKLKAAKIQKIREEMQSLAEKLQALEIKIPMFTNKEGKLYGSVTTAKFAELLAEKGFELDKRKIHFDRPVHEIGNYTAKIDLFRDIKVEIPFAVISEQKQDQAEKDSQEKQEETTPEEQGQTEE